MRIDYLLEDVRISLADWLIEFSIDLLFENSKQFRKYYILKRLNHLIKNA